jgi:hypothetical protein
MRGFLFGSRFIAPEPLLFDLKTYNHLSYSFS